MSNTRLGGYPASIGNKVASLINHTGPTSYTVVTPGSTPAGGDTIKASAFGLKFIESIDPAMDATGAYFVMGIPSNPGPCATWILRWFVVAGGPPATIAEVGVGSSLDEYTVRIRAIGLP